MSAKRIQRRRTAGWRMPAGAVYVGRPAKWGNPFVAVQDTDGVDLALAFYAYTAQGIWSPSLIPKHWSDVITHCVYQRHSMWLHRVGGHPLEVIPYELAGRDLACWCPLDQPCHADVLLEIANAGLEATA